ncbi:MAG: hypothetical protein FWH24_01940 [Oscillospiraceae bacterium]|nr:hypothetical protein [Oscillospiraceae bacterium]
MAEKKAKIETLDKKILDERIKSGKIGGIYCFFGEEEYMADYYAEKLTALCGDDCAGFDPDNFDLAEFHDAVMSYALDFGGYKSVLLKNCGNIKFKSGEKEELITLLSDNTIKEFACVIFKYKELEDLQSKSARRDKNLSEFLKQNAELFEFKINSAPQLTRWLKNICKTENTELSDDCAGYILARGELRMYPLKHDTDKLIRYAQSRGTPAVIMREDIDLLLPKKTELEAFELTNAVLGKNYGKAFQCLEKLKYFKEEPVFVLGQISRYFCDLLPVILAGGSDNVLISRQTGIHEYKVKLILGALRKHGEPDKFIRDALELCRECDIKLKSTALPGYNMLENLIFNIAQL